MTQPSPDPVTPILPDWTNRRRVIFWSLTFAAASTAAVVLAACFALFLDMYFRVGSDANAIGLLTTILYTMTFFATSIIGSYVFGVNFDYANARQHVANFITESKTAVVVDQPQQVTVSTTTKADQPPVVTTTP